MIEQSELQHPAGVKELNCRFHSFYKGYEAFQGIIPYTSTCRIHSSLARTLELPTLQAESYPTALQQVFHV